MLGTNKRLIFLKSVVATHFRKFPQSSVGQGYVYTFFLQLVKKPLPRTIGLKIWNMTVWTMDLNLYEIENAAEKYLEHAPLKLCS